MSIWSSIDKNVEGQPVSIIDSPKKAYTKIDPTSKLQIIQALDNGQCKSDLAREYGVHPQTIAHIYKQKDSIIKKYTQKYNLLQQVCSLNLEQNLLNWLEQEFKVSNVITEDQLRDKVLDILKPLREEFTCIDDWLLSFRLRHNITKYTEEGMHDNKYKEQWKRYLKCYNTKDVYLGGVCALSHDFELQSYLSGQNAESYVSLLFIINTLGTDKKEMAVVTKELLEPVTNVRSLPVNYYYCVNSQVNHSLINCYLKKWDNELSSKEKYITLILNVPDNIIKDLHFNNIKIVSTRELDYVIMVLEKLEECFKYNYRKLQISRSLTHGKDSSTFLDYIHMIGNAWYNIPQKYIQSLCLPPEEGSLCFNTKDDNEHDHSISKWSKAYNIPLTTEQCTSSVDNYILCDNTLPCIYYGQSNEHVQTLEDLSEASCQSNSGMEAYQAMKRLVSYLQGEGAGGSIMKYAKYLENHMEYGALVQMHQIISSTNDSVQ